MIIVIADGLASVQACLEVIKNAIEKKSGKFNIKEAVSLFIFENVSLCMT